MHTIHFNLITKHFLHSAQQYMYTLPCLLNTFDYLLVCGGREEEGLCNGALLTGMWREGGGRTVQSRTGDGFSCGEETASSSNIFTSPSFIKHNIIIS